MDLESPFLKTALVKGSGGALEEREVTKAKILGDKIELTAIKGGVALFPVKDLLAVLPKLPNADVVYQLKDVNEAIRMLESLPTDLKQRPEASTDNLQKWKDLRKPAEEAEAERRREEEQALAQKAIEKSKMETARLAIWLKDVEDFQKPRTQGELERLRSEGQKFLVSKTGDSIKIYDYLACLSQVLPKEKGGALPDLVNLNEVQSKLVPDDFLVWATAGILLVSFFGLLVGLSFTSAGFSRLREGFVLGGVVLGGLGLAILSGLVAIWWPITGVGESISFAVTPTMERAILFSKNNIKPVYYLPGSVTTATRLEFASSILASLPPSDEPSGIFKGKLKEGELWVEKDSWTWKQPVTALGIPIPVSFVFKGKIPNASKWSDVVIEKVSLGKVTFPDVLGSIFCEGMKSTFESGLSSGGFASIKVSEVESGQLIISTQASGKKPNVEVKEEVKIQEVVREVYQKDITAEALGKLAKEGKIDAFIGKFVLLDGIVSEILSGSEYSGDVHAGKGTGLDVKKAKMKDDDYDVFYLKSVPKIKCLIKSTESFAKDNFGDIYLGPKANIVHDEPLIKNGCRVRFLTEGRVQEFNRIGEIEVYGIRLDSGSDIQCYDPHQKIVFSQLERKIVGDSDFDLNAEARYNVFSSGNGRTAVNEMPSGLPIAYSSSNPSVASVTRNRVTILSPGQTTITAEQAGDEIWSRATASQVLNVDPAPAKK